MSSPLSGFTAVPNPQMLAFMGAQSFIMMFQAGEGWQYGKRRISAMSNEDFNKLTPERLLQNQAATLRSSLGTIEKSMRDMTPMIRTIVSQYGDFLLEIIKVLPKVSQDVVKEVLASIPEGGFPGKGDKQIIEILKRLIPSLPSATAQVPSGGSLTTSASQFFGPPEKTPKLVLPPAGTNTRGFLGGPAAIPSVAQRFRTFEQSRNKDLKLLKEMQKNRANLASRVRAMQFSQRTAVARRLSSNAKTIGRAVQLLKARLAQQDKLIVFQKIKIRRR